MVYLAGLILAGAGCLIFLYFYKRSPKNRTTQILERLDQQDYAIVAICMKVQSNFAVNMFSKKLANDKRTSQSVEFLYRKVEDIRKNYKRTRGCLIRLIPEHPEFGNVAMDIDRARQCLKHTELNAGLLRLCMEDIKADAVKHWETPGHFLKMCSLSIRQLEEAEAMARQCAVDLNELESVMSSQGNARI